MWPPWEAPFHDQKFFGSFFPKKNAFPLTVAIVLRTCDRPILLARALCGILGQTHEDWRLLLVNAGDPGPVEVLAETYATAFGDRLTLLHEAAPDPEQAAALGLAHPHARAADYVALHDDDDAWHPQFLREGLGFLGAEAGYVAVACHGWLVEERMTDGGVVEEARQPGFSEPHPLELARMLGGAGVPTICLLVRRAALDRLRDAADLGLALLSEGEVGVIPRRLAFTYRRGVRAGPYANRSARVERAAEIADILRRNRMLRAAGIAGVVPALGVTLAPALQAVNDRLDRNGGWGHGRHADTQERLIRLEAAIATLQQRSERALGLLAALELLLRPLGRIWAALERPRRWLGRLN